VTAPQRDSGGDGRSARDRILDTAYRLFSWHGTRAVGVDRIAREAGVTKMTLYRHFPSKDDLIIAVLHLRERRWTHEWLGGEMARLGTTPRERLLAVFDAFDEWFRGEEFEGCTFIAALVEHHGVQGSLYEASVRHLRAINAVLRHEAEQAGVRDPAEAAARLQMLMMGSIVSAVAGDLTAARTARGLAEIVLDGPADP
jgi:AcrR family transcriptional regulator